MSVIPASRRTQSCRPSPPPKKTTLNCRVFFFNMPVSLKMQILQCITN
jgi:hypothetical protein